MSPAAFLLLAAGLLACDPTPDDTGPAGTTAPIPVTIVDGPPALTADQQATFTFACDGDAPCVTTCALNDGPKVSCASPHAVVVPAGDHHFDVFATPPGGGPETSDRWTWTVDPTSPLVVDLAGPPNPSASPDATFTWGCSKDDCAFTCAIDGGDFAACASGVTVEDLADGPHTFAVRATDDLGTTGPAATWAWAIDTVDAVVVDLLGPDDPTNAADATFTWGCSKSDCTFTCALDDGAPAACTSPRTFPALADGPHTLEVRAQGPNDDAPGLPSTWTWTLDTVTPLVVDLDGPAGTIPDDAPAFTFACSKADCAFACTLTGTAQGVVVDAAACTSPYAPGTLADDAYTLAVVATDPAGNTGPAATRAFAIDTVSAVVVGLDGPADPTNATTATLT